MSDGMTFSTTVVFNGTQVEQRILRSASRAQKRLDAAVQRDSNYYCPLDSSALQKSGITETVIGSGLVVWETDYARKQYYGDYDHTRSKNPNACAKWFEAAKARRRDEWVRIVNESI